MLHGSESGPVKKASAGFMCNELRERERLGIDDIITTVKKIDPDIMGMFQESTSIIG